MILSGMTNFRGGSVWSPRTVVLDRAKRWSRLWLRLPVVQKKKPRGHGASGIPDQLLAWNRYHAGLAAGETGDLEASVVESVFTDGRYEVVAILRNGERLRIDSPTPANRGLDTRVSIDPSTVRKLTVDEV